VRGIFSSKPRAESIWRSRLACTVLLLLARHAVAQQALDLATALRSAEADNLELRAARQQRGLALAGLITARQMPNPTVTFAASRDSPHESALLDLPIELGGKRGKRIAVAQEESRLTDVEISVLGLQIRRRTREAFFRALSAQEQTGQAKAALDLASRIKDIVQQRFEAGDVAQLEVIQADVEVARANADYQSASLSQRSAEVQLLALLNRKLEAPLALSGKLEEIHTTPTLDALTTLASNSNADIQRSIQQIKTEERRLALAKAQRIPDVTLQAGTDLNSPPDFQVGPRGQIGVTLPIFYHGQGEVALSNAKLQLGRLTLQSQQINVSAQVAAAYFDYTAKFHLAEQYRDRIVPETLRLEKMAEESYQSGKSNLLTLIDAQRRLNDVRKAYLDSLFAGQGSFAALEEAVGVPLD
jgi:outer membrane protein, heavy metal efflux system